MHPGSSVRDKPSIIETPEGREAAIKERTLGVDVFGRSPDYDTNTDHVVRTAAGEVRKRLAQYYMGAPSN